MALFKIDNVTYNIEAVSITREAPVLDKTAYRTQDGNLHREVIGVYYNYTLTFPKANLDRAAYDALWQKVTEPVEFHSVTVPTSSPTIPTITYQAYITGVQDDMYRNQSGEYVWGNLEIKFIAKEPNRRPV